ncbi:unnamed protein product [Gadus morhua 'NCC']
MSVSVLAGGHVASERHRCARAIPRLVCAICFSLKQAQVKLSKTTGRSSNGRVPLYKPGDVGARRAPISKVFPSR